VSPPSRIDPKDLSLDWRLERVCGPFEVACKAAVAGGPWPRIEDFLSAPAGPGDEALVRELILLEVHYRRRAGEQPGPEGYQARFPGLDPAWLAGAVAAPGGAAADPQSVRTPPVTGEPGEDSPGRLEGCPPGGGAVPGYEILGELGRGGMGVVYQARQTRLNRLVALKMVLAGAHAGPEDLVRFLAEAEAVAALQHPHIVQIFEVGRHAALPFFALEYLEGGSLQDKLRGASLPPREAAQLVQTLARAMHAAHGRGIIHRDLKPANVLLDRDGRAKITDFGLARRVEGGAGLTQSGAIMGTPGYMAPEQAAGRSKEVGPAADVYALGAVLYECLTGRPPFKAATPLDTVLQVLSEEPVPPRRLQPQVPADLETICLTCLHKEPGRRYASALALADDLQRFQAGEPIRARPVSWRQRLVKWVKRRPTLAALLAVSGLALALLVGGLVAGNLVLAEKQRQTERILRLEQEKVGVLERDYYFNRNARAFGRWLNRDVGVAEDLLEECPPGLRGWEWYFVKRLCHSELFSLRGEPGAATAVAFSPDSKYLAWPGPDRTVCVIEVASRREVCALAGHTGAISGIAFSPDGKQLASASQDGTVRLWDLSSCREERRYPGHSGIVHSVAFSADGRRLASAGADRAVILWDVATGRRVRDFPGHTGPVLSVALGPDGKHLASASQDGTVRLWETDTGRPVRTLKADAGHVLSVAFSPKGDLALGCTDEVRWVQDVVRPGQQIFARPTEHIGAVTSVVYSGDGQYIASGSKDGTVVFRKAADGGRVRTYRAQAGGVTAVAFSPNRAFLASAGADGTVKVWDATRDQLGRALDHNVDHKGLVVSMAFSPDGCLLSSASVQQNVDHNRLVMSVAFSPDGRLLASASFQQEVKVWDPATGAVLWERQNQGRVVAFSPDSQLLAVGGDGGVVTLCAARKGDKVGSFQAHGRNPVVSLEFGLTRDGPRLASAAPDEGLKVWRLNRTRDKAPFAYEGLEVWRAERTKDGPPFPPHGLGEWVIRSVAFSPDGNRLAAADTMGNVAVFEAGTGRLFCSFQEPGREIRCVTFNPTGNYLAAAVLTECRVKVWDLDQRKELYVLSGHTSWVNSITFTPDGERLASASRDQTVKVWDLKTEREALTLRGHTKEVFAVRFSPDGGLLASASADGSVRLWDATPVPPDR
jgi:WD40 repeat protein